MSGFTSSVLGYLSKVGSATLEQLFVLFGPLIVLAFFMNFLSKWNESLSYKTLGKNLYLYLFGWLGISLHELSHALFAILFGHKINDIKLFKPDPHSETLGYVDHSYNPRNVYHQVGNFFIGIGPVFMGAFSLYLLSLVLFKTDFNGLKISFADIHSMASLKLIFAEFREGFVVYIQTVFKGDSSNVQRIILFLYCLYSIGSSITLSASDVQTAWKGFLFVVVLFFIFNLATLWISDFTHNLLTAVSSVFSGFYAVMVLSIVVSLLFMVLLIVVLVIKKMVSPKPL